MRLSQPVYESMPVVYATLGGLGFWVAYADPEGSWSVMAFGIAILAEVAALTVFLRRQDYRDLSREYSGETIELPSTPN